MTKIFINTTKRKKTIFIKVAEQHGKKLATWMMDVLNEHLKAQFIDAAMKSGISFSALELKHREDGWVDVNPDSMNSAGSPKSRLTITTSVRRRISRISSSACTRNGRNRAEPLTRSRKRFLRSQAFTSRLKTKRSRGRPWDEDCD